MKIDKKWLIIGMLGCAIGFSPLSLVITLFGIIFFNYHDLMMWQWFVGSVLLLIACVGYVSDGEDCKRNNG